MIKIKRIHNLEEFKNETDKIIFEETYPFQKLWYFDKFADNFCRNKDVYILGFYWEDKLIGYGGFEKIEKDKMVFLGMKKVMKKEEISDFGEVVLVAKIKNIKSKIYELWDKILNYFKNEGILHITLDYVKEDSYSMSYFKNKKKCKIAKKETSPAIVFQKIGNWNEYLMSLKRKKRKEIRRKIRRMEEVRYEYKILEKIENKDFKEFVRLHKTSDKQKEKFMSKKMEEFFWSIVNCEKEEWKSKLAFLKIKNRMAAALLYFESKTDLLLYNSGFDPKLSYYSAGFLLAAEIIKRAINEKKKKVDFLRGEERYKYDLGAEDYWLYKIEFSL